MSALYGAVALTEMHAHTVAIAEHLHLDVTRLLDVLLAIDFRRAERCASLRLTGGERLCGGGALAHDSHAAAAATGRRLEDDGIAGLVGDLERLRLTLERQLAAGHDRHARLLGDDPRLRLVAHQADGLRARPDERQTGGPTGVRERRILGQESIPRVNGLAVGHDGRRD